MYADSVVASEYEALIFLLESLSSNLWNVSNLIIFSDNQLLVDIVQSYNFLKHKSWPLDERFLVLANRFNIVLKKLNRNLNSEADFLAGQGARRSKMLHSWC